MNENELNVDDMIGDENKENNDSENDGIEQAHYQLNEDDQLDELDNDEHFDNEEDEEEEEEKRDDEILLQNDELKYGFSRIHEKTKLGKDKLDKLLEKVRIKDKESITTDIKNINEKKRDNIQENKFQKEKLKILETKEKQIIQEKKERPDIQEMKQKSEKKQTKDKEEIVDSKEKMNRFNKMDYNDIHDKQKKVDSEHKNKMPGQIRNSNIIKDPILEIQNIREAFSKNMENLEKKYSIEIKDQPIDPISKNRLINYALGKSFESPEREIKPIESKIVPDNLQKIVPPSLEPIKQDNYIGYRGNVIQSNSKQYIPENLNNQSIKSGSSNKKAENFPSFLIDKYSNLNFQREPLKYNIPAYQPKEGLSSSYFSKKK